MPPAGHGLNLVCVWQPAAPQVHNFVFLMMEPQIII